MESSARHRNTSEQPPERILSGETLRRLGGKTLGLLLPAMVGFALARTGLPGEIYPFAAAYAAAVPSGSVATAMAGVLLGFILPGGTADALRCAASALAVAGIKWALAELKPVKDSPLFPPAAALTGVVLTGMVVTSSVGAAISFDLARYLAEGAMSAACAFFFCTGLECWKRRRSGSLSYQELCCAAASLCVLCIPLCRISLFGVSPFSAAIMLAALAIVHRMGPAGGAAAGIALGAVQALADQRFSLLGVCAAAALTAAMFRPLGCIAVSAVFTICSSLCVAASGQVDIYFLIEAVLAAVAFPIIGADRLSFIFDIMEPVDLMRTAVSHGDLVPRQLRDAARGLEDASQTVQEVSRRLEQLETPKAGTVCRRAAEDICADCAISRFCWETSREQTGRLFDSLCDILRKEGRLTRRSTPEQLRSRCARWGEMSERINALYAEFSANESARRRVAQVRQAVAGQMLGCGLLLDELAEDSGRKERVSAELSDRAARCLEETGITAEDVCCLYRGDGSLAVTLTLRCSEDYPEPELDAADILSQELEIDFDSPAVTRQGDSLLMRLDSCPAYALAVGAAQHSRGGGRLCGDAYRVLTGTPAGEIILLSDGMGTGGRAAVDAAMTCDLMGRLLEAGFGEKGAMELVNSAVQISSEDESLATLDCARVDLYTGELRLNKAGAPASYLLRGGEVEQITADSLPLGIMQRVDSGQCRLQLQPDDVVVMVSDGAAGQEEDWLAHRLACAETMDVNRAARDILALASARCAPEDDDITVIVMRLDCRDAQSDEAAA